MNIQLEHSFLLTSYDLKFLLKDCNLLSTFCSRLIKQSELFPDRQDPLKYRGEGFELFCEALIKLSPMDNRIGIYNYQNSKANSPGVDGFGLGSNGKPATVQCKFVDKKDSVLTANSPKSNLMGFSYLSQNVFNVDIKDVNNMLIITTAKGLHHYTDEFMFVGKVRCLGYGDSKTFGLRDLVDNNFAFWNLFRELVKI